MEKFTSFIPKLSFSKHKGNYGKIGIIGGCLEYSGAPYFAAASVLKLGGDLSHVFCSKDAAIPIKSYSPEIIVHPYIYESRNIPQTLNNNQKLRLIDESAENIFKWARNLDSISIGSGLGRDKFVLSIAEKVISKLIKLNKPLVIDGDGIFLINSRPSLISGHTNVIITPNMAEMKRIQICLRTSSIQETSRKLKGVTIVSKGYYDIVSNGKFTQTITVKHQSPRRIGGQGDIFAGTLALFSSYAPHNFIKAAFAASETVKKAAYLAFQKERRGMSTISILNQLPNVIPSSWNKL